MPMHDVVPVQSYTQRPMSPQDLALHRMLNPPTEEERAEIAQRVTLTKVVTEQLKQRAAVEQFGHQSDVILGVLDRVNTSEWMPDNLKDAFLTRAMAIVANGTAVPGAAAPAVTATP